MVDLKLEWCFCCLRWWEVVWLIGFFEWVRLDYCWCVILVLGFLLWFFMCLFILVWLVEMCMFGVLFCGLLNGLYYKLDLCELVCLEYLVGCLVSVEMFVNYNFGDVRRWFLFDFCILGVCCEDFWSGYYLEYVLYLKFF